MLLFVCACVRKEPRIGRLADAVISKLSGPRAGRPAPGYGLNKKTGLLSGRVNDMETLRSTAGAAGHMPHAVIRIAHRADSEYPFLHDTMIARLGGRLLLAWYNCTENEIEGHTVIRGRWSDDEGESWSEPEIIAEDRSGGHHMVPVTFAEIDGKAIAYATEMTSHDRPVGYRCYARENGEWREKAIVPLPVLINTLPQPCGGTLVAGGRMAEKIGGAPLIPVVLRLRGGGYVWDPRPLPGPWEHGDYALRIPETAILTDGARIDAVVRNDSGSARYYSSGDCGVTWSGGTDIGFPAVPSKMCGGRLDDGRQYLIYNEPAGDDPRRRVRLVIAVREKPYGPFVRSWILAEGFNTELGAGPYWHYPCACVSGDLLHVSCTASDDSVVRHAAVISVPLREL